MPEVIFSKLKSSGNFSGIGRPRLSSSATIVESRIATPFDDSGGRQQRTSAEGVRQGIQRQLRESAPGAESSRQFAPYIPLMRLDDDSSSHRSQNFAATSTVLGLMREEWPASGRQIKWEG